MLLFPAVAAFSFTKKPQNPTIVVVGHNSSRVILAWNYTAYGGEQIGTMLIQRLNSSNSNSNPVTLAGRVNPQSQGKVDDAFNKDGHFEFEDPASLVINQVTAKDEFVYRCLVQTGSNFVGYKSEVNLKVYSKCYDIYRRSHFLNLHTVFLLLNFIYLLLNY